MKITRTKSGKYSTLVAIPGIDGKRHYKRFTARSKAEVRNLADDYLNAHKVAVESMAFSAAAERFLSRSAQTLSPSTIRGYKSYLRSLQEEHAVFCARQIDRITKSDLQNIILTMSAAGKSPKTIKNWIGFISAVMSSEGIRIPPIQMPKQVPHEIRVPSEDIVKQIAQTAAGTRYEVPFALAVFGLRCGEVCAVTAEDLDGDILHVRRAIALDDNGKLHVKPPKSRAGDRFIPIPHHIAELIREQGRATDMTPKAWSDAFPDLLRRAGITEDQRFRLHDCRHFFVSYCHDVLKLSDAEIIKLSGHETDSVMKRVYRHAITDHAEDVRGALGSIMCQ